MAKVLDALARAQQERLRRQQPGLPVDADAPIRPEPSGPRPVVEPVGQTRSELAPVDPLEAEPPVHPTVADVVVGAHDTLSPIAEQVRQIRTNLDAVLADYASRPIVVTSPVAGDGKTLFAANLAWTLTDNPQQRTLLIDADLRKGEQNRLFGMRRAPGLSEYLRGQGALDQAINRTSMPNLDVMPGGRATSKPTALLSSDRLAALLDQLRPHYTWIVFDTPPLLPVTDATLIGRLCVGLILVVRMGKTQRAAIARAQDLLAENRLPVLGCVLNEFEPMSRAYEYYQRLDASKERMDGDGR